MHNQAELAEILEREDVKNHIRRLEVAMSFKYRRKYSRNILVFASFQSWLIVFHYGIMKSIEKKYNVHANHFMVLAAAYIISKQWNLKNIFGRSSVFNKLLEGIMASSTMYKYIHHLTDHHYLYPIAHNILSHQERHLLRKKKVPFEKLYRLEPKAERLIETYTKALNRKIGIFFSENGDMDFDIRKALGFVINNRMDLTGYDGHLRKVMQALPIELLLEKTGSTSTDPASVLGKRP